MPSHMHHIRGRLRVRSPRVMRNAAECTSVRRLLHGTPGIRRVSTSPVTGSITITYDPARITGSDLLDLLRGHGHVTEAVGGPGPGTAAAERLGQAVVSVVIERLAERSLTALIAALI